MDEIEDLRRRYGDERLLKMWEEAYPKPEKPAFPPDQTIFKGTKPFLCSIGIHKWVESGHRALGSPYGYEFCERCKKRK